MGKGNGLAIAAAFLGGAVIGAAACLLLAPDKGENTRKKIREALEKSGIKFDKDELESLVSRVKDAVSSSDDDDDVEDDATDMISDSVK